MWLYDPSRKVGVCYKLRNHWKGPFIVTNVLDDLICLVKQGAKQKNKAYHIDRLIPMKAGIHQRGSSASAGNFAVNKNVTVINTNK